MHLTLHLTARCNLNCRYCYAAPHQGEEMNLETARRAITIGIRDNQRRNSDQNLGVIFFGGEPLLKRELIYEIVRYCRGLESGAGPSFYFKITTNGLLLDEAFLTDPETAPIFVAISHDGIQRAHDAHRVDSAGRGSFNQLTPIIPLLLKHKPYAPVLMVITPDTLPYYAESIDYLFHQGFHYLICSLDYGAEWNETSVKELRRQYEKLADWYYEKTRQEKKFYFSPFEVKIASHVFPGSCKRDRCELGLRQISVAPNGRLYPCVQFAKDGGDGTYAIGDVNRGIDEEARQRLYNRNSEEKKICAACAIRERCNHFCGCLNKQATGSIDQVSPMLCAHERTILPIVDRLAARLYQKRDPLFIQKHYNELFPLLSLVEDVGAAKLNSADPITL
jgi:uncharacterized protein